MLFNKPVIIADVQPMSSRVLIIDDEAAITDLLSEVLQVSGFEVQSVNSGEDGIKQVRDNPPQIVVLDLMMPRIDGWQTCKAIRQFSSIPILVLSPFDDPLVVASILDSGADDCLRKPVTTNVLVAHLRKLVRRATTMDKLQQPVVQLRRSTHPLTP
jgi:DNA-binding response OmpR family regulator